MRNSTAIFNTLLLLLFGTYAGVLVGCGNSSTDRGSDAGGTGAGGTGVGGSNSGGTGAGGSSAGGTSAGGTGAGGFTGSTGLGGTTGSTTGGTYVCEGGVVLAGTGGAPASFDGGPPVTCVVGESYCSIHSLNRVPGALPSRTCVGLTGLLAPCAPSPRCSCICSHGVLCQAECSCSDLNGFVTVSCSQI
jgi:hypothetical protein